MHIFDVESWTVVYFGSGIALMLLSFFIPEIAVLQQHGRILTIQSSWFHLSKNHFVWFYLIGCVCGIASLSNGFQIYQFCFVCFHLFRRLLETRFLLKSQSLMNWIHFLVGISFYPFVWVILDIDSKADIGQNIWSITILLSACYFQLQTHLQLARNRDRKQLPKYWLFHSFICPNFTFEIVIYLSLVIELQSLKSVLLFTFVCLNQIISAVDRKKCYPKAKKWAILPFL
jgi:hypothetical protein